MSASSASKAGKPATTSSPKKSKPQQNGKTSGKGLVRPAPRAKVRRARRVVSKVDTWSCLLYTSRCV